MKAVIVGVVLLVVALLAFAFLIVETRHEKRRLANPKMDALARDAAHLLSDMRVPTTTSLMDDADLLTDTTKSRIDSWLTRYKKEINK